MSDQVNIVEEQKGTVTFANEVVSTIAGIAACDIPGVAGMSGGLKDGIVDLLGKKNLSKGVKITLKDDTVVADIQIVVDYGVKVPEVCAKIQESVISAIETMTGLRVAAVNVLVQDLKLKDPAALAEKNAE